LLREAVQAVTALCNCDGNRLRDFLAQLVPKPDISQMVTMDVVGKWTAEGVTRRVMAVIAWLDAVCGSRETAASNTSVEREGGCEGCEGGCGCGHSDLDGWFSAGLSKYQGRLCLSPRTLGGVTSSSRRDVTLWPWPRWPCRRCYQQSACCLHYF
jgi:hypothetical protein